jgi:hypothetical protein
MRRFRVHSSTNRQHAPARRAGARQVAAGALIVSTVLAAVCCFPGCTSPKSEATADVLEFYRQQTAATDPGEYAFLYEGLPEEFDDLCTVIKHQLIHPVELGPLRKELPEERHFEDLKYPTVGEMLASLYQLDPEGLHLDRKPEDRLIVACWHHALLLASILKHREIPARVRAGFALYIAPDAGLHVGHAICEVWNDKKRGWMRIDPDRQMVDFRRKQFELPAEAWRALRRGAIEPGPYQAARSHGASAILDILCIDLKSVLSDNSPYWENLRIAEDNLESLEHLTAAEVEVIDRVASLLANPDVHLEELQALQEQHECLRQTM